MKALLCFWAVGCCVRRFPQSTTLMHRTTDWHDEGWGMLWRMCEVKVAVTPVPVPTVHSSPSSRPGHLNISRDGNLIICFCILRSCKVTNVWLKAVRWRHVVSSEKWGQKPNICRFKAELRSSRCASCNVISLWQMERWNNVMFGKF